MTKYYVQSGTLRSIVQAESSRKAALWAVHQAMQQVLPIGDDSEQTPQSKSDRISCAGAAVLSGQVTVNEHGFDRRDSVQWSTVEVVSEWNQMVTTLDRLERMLCRAG